jgi:hypothetical protein
MEVKAGSRLRSVVCDTQIVVVRAPGGDVLITCGGHAVVPLDATTEPTSLDPEYAGGTLLGKRYADESGALELLCTKAGQGSLALGGRPLEVKQAKPLPSSD